MNETPARAVPPGGVRPGVVVGADRSVGLVWSVGAGPPLVVPFVRLLPGPVGHLGGSGRCCPCLEVGKKGYSLIRVTLG